MAITLRLATLGDSDFLLRLRNDPLVRAMSKDVGVIHPDIHQQWFESALCNPSIHLYVIESDHGVHVGSARLDVHDRVASISLTIVKDFRRMGYGTKAITALWTIAADHGCTTITAEVKGRNIGSLKAFLSAGFVLQPNRLIALEKKW